MTPNAPSLEENRGGAHNAGKLRSLRHENRIARARDSLAFSKLAASVETGKDYYAVPFSVITGEELSALAECIVDGDARMVLVPIK